MLIKQSKKVLSLPVPRFCTMYKWTTNYYSSRKIKNNSKEKLCYEVNVRAAMAMREIGRGHAALEKLFGLLSLPEPPHPITESDIYKNIVDASNNGASHLMIYAANEIESTRDENRICDITVLCDGTWQRRGYNPFNGIVTELSNPYKNL